jgi:hypothetical protein
MSENGRTLRILLNIILLIPLICFLYCLVTTQFSVPINKTSLSELILTASIALTSFLIAVVAILISIYWSPSTTDPGRNALRPLIWWVTAIICASTFTSFLDLWYNLYGTNSLFIWILILFSIAFYMAMLSVINVVLFLEE